MRWCVAVAAATVVLAGGAPAQNVVNILPAEFEAMLAAQGEVVTLTGSAAAPGGALAGGAGGDITSQRLEKLKALVFDRRPSAILAAWALPEPEPLPMPEEPEAAEPEDGTVADGDRGTPIGDTDADGAGTTDADGAGTTDADTTGDDADADDTGTPGDDATTAGASAAGATGGSLTPSASGAPPVASGGTGALNPVGTTPPSGTAPATLTPVGGTPPAPGSGGTPVPGGLTRVAKTGTGATTPGATTPGASTPAAPPTPGSADEVAAAPAGDTPAADPAAEAAAAEAERQQAITEALDRELEIFQRHVTLGRWAEVDTYLAGLTEEEAEAAWVQLLKSLSGGPPRIQSPFAKFAEAHVYTPDDVAGLIATLPGSLEVEDVHRGQLGQIVQQCVEQGPLPAQVVDRLAAGRAGDELAGVDDKLLAAVLVAAGLPVEAAAFLPDPAEAVEADDREALNLLSQHYLALEDDDDHLEQAWQVLQAVLADGEVEDDQKEEALERAVALAPRLREELGQGWLEESFTARPRRGMEILRVIGGGVAQGLVEQAKAKDLRLRKLQLQTTAAEALLAAAPELAAEWADTLTLLAGNWLREARFTYENDTSTSRGPSLDRDAYGNFYYYSYRNARRSNVPDPILTGEILDIQPSAEWLAHVDEALQPELAMVNAQLLLKIGEEENAFPFIESLAGSHPEQAAELVDEFLRVWADNHDPNDANSRRTNYVYFFGFEERADGIPLTRSKQERNLTELAGWVRRLTALPLPDGLDEKLLANCFVRAHSTAEVYRLETIEQVFGSMQALEPATLAELAQGMRGNLATVWRDPNTQKDSKTRRRQKDIQAEVQRGYEVARGVVEQGLVDHPGSWRLRLVLAAILHDENNYRQEISQSSGFAGARQAAFDMFARAADDYAAALDELDDDERSADPYLTWFYAALGACDLGALRAEQVPVARQVERVREAIEALPPEQTAEHLELFANTLFTRMSSVAPPVKYSYVRHGLQIVGDHERAREARDVYEYYEDLVTEIRLETRLDGVDSVGHGEPFGLFVDLRHTREIEREAGGFGKYLTNQNNNSGFSWNYGRPTENYRDKFEEAAREALAEHFDVRSITFNHPEVHSQAEAEYGWRVTPYAYVLLAARGPEVDRVPPLQLHLDFLDTTGYAVLPVESSPLMIDAGERSPVPRPYDDLKLVQTLDERRAAEGKLMLEVQATALGLVPDLDQILDVGSEGFEVVGVDDQGVAVSQFEEEGDGRQVVSERLWTVELAAREDLAELPERFTFASARVDVDEHLYQRYDDADLASVEAEIELMAEYGEAAGPSWWPWLLGAALLGGLVWAGRHWATADPADAGARYAVPEDPTPFAVLGLLQQMESDERLPPGQRPELQDHITALEAWYFAERRSGASPDARSIARTWVQRLG